MIPCSIIYFKKFFPLLFQKVESFQNFHPIQSTPHTHCIKIVRERERMSVHKKNHPFDRNVKKVLSETRREAESIVRGSGKRFKRTFVFDISQLTHISILSLQYFF